MQLRRTSGFLAQYPGQSMVPFSSDVGLIAKAVGLYLGGVGDVLVEELALSNGFNFVIETILGELKDLGIDTLKDWYDKGKVHWGRAAMPTSARFADEPALYESYGRQVWPVFPSNFDGLWESQDENARFRLEISGAAVVWIERAKGSGQEIRRDATIIGNADSTEFLIMRPYDEDLLRFQFPSSWANVLAQDPKSSYMTILKNGSKLIASYRGFRISAGEFLQPDDQGNKAQTFEFQDVRWLAQA